MKMRKSFFSMICFFVLGCNGVYQYTESPRTTKSDWVKLEGGCFSMGESTIYKEEGPVVEVCVEPFEIWSHEISNYEFNTFVNETGYISKAESGWGIETGVNVNPGSAVFIAPESTGSNNWWSYEVGANWKYPQGLKKASFKLHEPVVHITLDDAKAYASWVGGRIPTEAEWEYAARGGLDGTLMSWPDAERSALKNKANTWDGIFPVINTKDDGFIGVAPVGSYPPNGFGLYDMIGNVWEWTSSVYYPGHMPGNLKETYPDGYDPAQKHIPVGVIKGGSYLCAKSYCYRYRPAARQAQDLMLSTSHTGFRVVRSN
jgi:formylglycine-generating enzyme required for sulfatase activity